MKNGSKTILFETKVTDILGSSIIRLLIKFKVLEAGVLISDFAAKLQYNN